MASNHWLKDKPHRFVKDLLDAEAAKTGRVVSHTPQDVANLVQRLCRLELDGLTAIQYLVLSLEKNIVFHGYARTHDSGSVKSLFFVVPGADDLFKQWPEVLLIDATYNTNK